MKKALQLIVATAVASTAYSLNAAGKGSDATGEYYEDSVGVKHYYLFHVAYNGKLWSINNNSYSRVDAANGTGGVSWIPGSIFTFAQAATYAVEFAANPETTMYGFEFEALERFRKIYSRTRRTKSGRPIR